MFDSKSLDKPTHLQNGIYSTLKQMDESIFLYINIKS